MADWSTGFAKAGQDFKNFGNYMKNAITGNAQAPDYSSRAKVPYPEHMGAQQDSANHPANSNESSNLKPEQEMR